MSYRHAAAAGLFGLALAAGSAPAQEQDAQEQDAQPPAEGEAAGGEDKALVGAGARGYDPEKAFFGPLPRYVSPDGNISAGAGLVLQLDAGDYGASSAPPGTVIDRLKGGTRDRRAILIANGLFYDDFIFFGTWDFFDRGKRNINGLRSAMLAWRRYDPLWFTVGQQTIASPLDAARGVRAFMEESMASGAFGYAPGTPSLGAAVSHRGPNHNVRAGLYSVPAAEIGGDREGWGIHARANYAPVVERTRALHFGIAGYWRKPTILKGETAGGETFSARPEVRIDDESIVVSTGRIPGVDSFHYVSLEAAGVWGPWSLQGELQRVGVTRAAGPGGAYWPDLEFAGHYLLGSYFLTGESRNYYQRLGSFWRVKPHREFDPWGAGGWGAFEVAARASHIDLDDAVGAPGGVAGGSSDNVTLGFNWYFDAFKRLSINWVRADVDRRDAAGAQVGGKVNAIAARLQLEF